MILLSLLGLLSIVYLYGGYVLTLVIIKKFRKNILIDVCNKSSYPTVTIIITAYNEEAVIISRIENILACDYPKDCLEVIVASDGSSDKTDNLVLSFENDMVRLFRPVKRRGKSDAQNQAVGTATGEILIFTDAGTQFSVEFIKELVKPFDNAQVGGVDGHLLFLNKTFDSVSQSQGFYWRQELWIRALESSLGFLAVGSGACLAVRKNLFHRLKSTVGEDCLIPLDVVSQGFFMVHASDAVAYDQMPSDLSKEFQTRVRMTLRNWQGTWMYPDLLNPIKRPGVAFGLWSHKILRWLSPVFLLIWLVFGLLSFSVPFSSPIFFVSWLSLFFICAAAIGALANYLNIHIPLVGTVYDFCLANAGFFVGVTRALLGRKITIYK